MVMDTTAMDITITEVSIVMETEFTMEVLDKTVELPLMETRQHHLLITIHAF